MAPLRKLKNRRFADDPQSLSLQNVNYLVKLAMSTAGNVDRKRGVRVQLVVSNLTLLEAGWNTADDVVTGSVAGSLLLNASGFIFQYDLRLGNHSAGLLRGDKVVSDV
jgi:hypothetical protein